MDMIEVYIKNHSNVMVRNIESNYKNDDTFYISIE